MERNGPGRASAAALECYRRERGRRGTKQPGTVQLCLEECRKLRNAFGMTEEGRRGIWTKSSDFNNNNTDREPKRGKRGGK